MILTLRTDKVEAEIGLYENNNCLEYFKWPAHRQLSTSLHRQIEDLLSRHQQTWQDISGIVIYKGPGSFTGLRIGFSVANTLAYGLNIPIVSSSGDAWTAEGVKLLVAGENEKVALPDYGGPAQTTSPKK